MDVEASIRQLKCFQCNYCDEEDAVAKSCELSGANRCLKFVGIDRASK